MPPNAIQFPPEAEAALARGDIIQAIKIVREANGLDLKGAKAAVEAYSAQPDAGRRLIQALGAKAEAANLVFPPQVADALSHGNLIEAIKRLREANPQLGLKEAKDAVDTIVKRHPADSPARHAARRVPTVVQGDSGRGGWVWILAAMIAFAAWWWLSGRS